jgi:hypothetical protein
MRVRRAFVNKAINLPSPANLSWLSMDKAEKVLEEEIARRVDDVKYNRVEFIPAEIVFKELEK